jgi:hypothetical protein
MPVTFHVSRIADRTVYLVAGAAGEDEEPRPYGTIELTLPDADAAGDFEPGSDIEVTIKSSSRSSSSSAKSSR